MKVIAFDVFGTVFKLDDVPREDVRNYVKHIRQPVWSPLELPKSWETLPSHDDAARGIQLLREKFIVVTCSNGPLGLLTKLSKHNNISWDAIIPLELNQVYKPNPKAYLTVSVVLDVSPSDILMVTANETFGDLEGAKSVGMNSILIRDDKIPTIVSLYEYLNASNNK